jgi:MSHA pilin protein MshA
MRNCQPGFTLIELVTVIVILGIVAAVAFPKFQSLSANAQQTVVDSTAGAIKAEAVLLFAKNNGSKSTSATITNPTNLDYDATRISITGTGGVGNCATVNVTYIGSSPTVSRAAPISTDYCQ